MSKLSRRALLIRTATGAAAVLQARKAIAEPPSPRPETPDDPTKIQGRGWKPVGERSPFEQPERLPYENHDVSTSPLQALSGIITPADLHFERHHGGVPAIDPER